MMPPVKDRVTSVTRTAARLALLVVLLGGALPLSGCLYIGGMKPSNGWEKQPRDVIDDWRRVDMQSLMAYSDTWFVVDENQRGTVKGYASGGFTVSGNGGFFELSVIYRANNVPVEQSVRVYFDDSTQVYEGGQPVGTVLAGITGQGSYDITQGGKILEVPFHLNGGRMFAEKVVVTDQRQPLVP